jgi:hypothetical protein
MKEPDLLGRREFTLQAALAVLAGTTITISACGSGGNKSPTGPSGSLPDINGVVSANHNHRAVLSGADVVGGVAVTLNIQGGATHPHLVALSATEIASLRRGEQVSKTSSTGDSNSHTHVVTFLGPQGGNNPYD